jgi:hypothetical protein
LLSVTEFTVATVSFHPTTTTFRSPATCAAAYATATDDRADCGVADATWMKAVVSAIA